MNQSTRHGRMQAGSLLRQEMAALRRDTSDSIQAITGRLGDLEAAHKVWSGRHIVKVVLSVRGGSSHVPSDLYIRM